MENKKTNSKTDSGKVRLQKLMAAAGLDSRRACEQMILDGRVAVNGKVVKKMPVLIRPDQDEIIVDGQKLKTKGRTVRLRPQQGVRPAKLVYYLLNKPKGVICTNRDATDRRQVKSGRLRAIDLMVGVRQRLVSVGRLDVDSRGLLIMTNDGELVNQLTHPRHEVPKTYRLRIDGSLTAADIDKLTKGLWMTSQRPGKKSDAQPAKAANVRIVHRDQKQTARGEKGRSVRGEKGRTASGEQGRTVLQVVLREGKNRQIRRMMSHLGYKVRDLVRIKIGPVSIKGLPVGAYRPMMKQEVLRLKAFAKV